MTAGPAGARAARFELGERDFLLDGTPHQIVSGALHYFRVHPDQWRDRIRRAKALGLNAIETYVAWNFHAPSPGELDLTGARDLGRFLSLVRAEGLHAIVRPGPYICAEWDNGGLPAWLFADPEVGVRRAEPRFLAAVQEYFDAVLPVIAAAQVDRGGPVILVQVENEYGAYGDDPDYLRALAGMLRAGGITVPLFTCDQATDAMLARGGLPELLRTATFGSRSPERLATLRRHQPSGPLMCTEYWNGWFDAWGEDHHATDPHGTADDLAALLAAGASVNLYLVHGGTNFAFTSGANDKGVYRPTTTSYDYDAPLAEDGAPTPKADALRAVITDHRGIDPAPVPPRRTAPVPAAALAGTADLRALAGASTGWLAHRVPPTHDALGHWSGLSLYRTRVAVAGPAVLSVAEIRDRAQVFCDGRPVGIWDRESDARAVTLAGSGAVEVELLVEDQGRVNYGPRIGEPKGVVGPVLLDGAEVLGWEVLPLPLDRWVRDVPPGAAGVPAGPSLARWRVAGTDPADLFVSTAGWGKGMVWFNGWNLGRFWSRGPQTTLYVPAPLVRPDGNDVVVLELLTPADRTLRFATGPAWRARTD